MNGLRSTGRANPGALHQVSQKPSIQGLCMASGAGNGETSLVCGFTGKVGGGNEA